MSCKSCWEDASVQKCLLSSFFFFFFFFFFCIREKICNTTIYVCEIQKVKVGFMVVGFLHFVKI